MVWLKVGRRRGWLVLFCSVLLFCLSLMPAAAMNAGAAEEPIRIGVSLGLSGKYSVMARDQQRAFQLWAKEVNAGGGLLGRSVSLTILDDQSRPEKAQELYRQMLEEDGVDLLFAPFSSEITGAVLPLFEQHRLPLLASGAADGELWQQGSSYIFAIFTAADRIPAPFLDLLLMYGFEHLALLHTNEPFALSAAAGVRKRARWLNLELRLDESFESKGNAYRPMLARAKATGSEVLILAGHLQEAVNLRQAMAEINWFPRLFYATQGPANPAFVEQLGPLAEGVFGTEQWQHLAGVTSPESDYFLASYRAKYSDEASYFSVTAYCAGQLLATAVHRAGRLEGEKLRQELAGFDTSCLTGRFRVDSRGRQVLNFALVTQWQDGHLEVVWPRQLMTAEPRL